MTRESIEQVEARIQESLRHEESLVASIDAAKNDLDEALENGNEYSQLNNVVASLQQLIDSGAGRLFWENLFSNEEELQSHLLKLTQKADEFNQSINHYQQTIADLEKELVEKQRDTAYLYSNLQYLKEREEDSKNDLTVHREIEKHIYRPVLMPWSSSQEDTKRYRLFMLAAFFVSLFTVYVVPLITIPEPEVLEVVEVPERLTKFIKRELKKEKPKPKPTPQVSKKVDKKVASKEKPTTKEIKKARKKASTSGLLAFKNNFADLMDEASEARLGANAKLSKQGTKAKSTTRSIITSQAKSGSGGINTSSLSRDKGGAGGKIGAVKFSRVTSEIGTAIDDRPLSDAPGPSRTDEEIQIVFDRYKAALYRIYNRQLRNNPTLQGKMVLRITIMPDGSVSACKVESTDLKSKTLSKKIVARVKRFNFGKKDNVPKITILYPIDFLPAS